MMRIAAAVTLTLLMLLAPPAKAVAPHIFFSDLISGPNSGGEGGLGAFVTIYGVGFGSSQGTSIVTVGDQPAGAYAVWSDTHVSFQPGPQARSGSIQVKTPSGPSNTIPFEIRAGNIYFVATNGKDGNSGSSTSPWKSIPHAVQTISSGDIVYARDGVVQDADDGEGWDAALTLRPQWCSMTGYPRALVAYPGSTVTIGPALAMSPASGLRTVDFSADGGACAGNWVFAGLRFRGANPIAINGPSSHWRLVGNDISCPQATGSDGGGACLETTLGSYVAMYGNNVHDAGASNASALFQGVYFSTDSNHIDMGWNTVANVKGCRGIQVHSSPLGSGYPNSGFNQYDISIHDNLIHHTQCDGIIIDTVDPSKGSVSIYNNVIYAAGQGPENPENTGNWACIYAPATTEYGPIGKGTIEVFNNTLSSCGTFATPPYGSANAAIVGGSLPIHIRNNIIFQVPSKKFPLGVPYLVVWDTATPNGGRVCTIAESCPGIQGENNLFYGSNQKASNSWITASITNDPLFMNALNGDFHLQFASPAIGHGVDVPILLNYDGQPRTSVTGLDIGALGIEVPNASRASRTTAQ